MNITITQATDALHQELISMLILNKLYNLAISGDHLMNLSGNLYCDKGHQSRADYLHLEFPNLTITIPSSGQYIAFEDPEVERILKANNIGDGDGITSTDLSNVSSIGTWFLNNTDIVSFNELRYTNVHIITEGAFRGCTNLESIDLSKIAIIQRGAFKNCSSLISIDLSTATDIRGNYNQGGCFENCTSLTSVSLPRVSSFSGIESRFFMGCTGLTTVSLPTSTNTGVNSFSGCTSLTTVSIPNATSISLSSFEGCTSLSTIDLSNITTIGQGAFRRCSNLTIELNLPNLTSIGTGAFYSSGITKIKSLGNITSIPGPSGGNDTQTFGQCDSLTEVDLTTTPLTTIGPATFVGCDNLVLVKLPSTVTSIGDYAFMTESATATAARTYYIYATTPPDLNSKRALVENNNTSTLPAAIYVPSESVEAYKQAPIWTYFSGAIQAIPTT